MMKKTALLIATIFMLAMFAAPAMAGDMKSKDKLKSGHKTSDLMGKPVVSEQGDQLGSVQNLVVGDDGQIKYVVLSRDGALGAGEEYVAVPWEAGNFRIEDDQLIASIDRETMQKAPGFGGDDWSQFDDSTYRGYFGLEEVPHEISPRN